MFIILKGKNKMSNTYDIEVKFNIATSGGLNKKLLHIYKHK